MHLQTPRQCNLAFYMHNPVARSKAIKAKVAEQNFWVGFSQSKDKLMANLLQEASEPSMDSKTYSGVK